MSRASTAGGRFSPSACPAPERSLAQWKKEQELERKLRQALAARCARAKRETTPAPCLPPLSHALALRPRSEQALQDEVQRISDRQRSGVWDWIIAGGIGACMAVGAQYGAIALGLI